MCGSFKVFDYQHYDFCMYYVEVSKRCRRQRISLNACKTLDERANCPNVPNKGLAANSRLSLNLYKDDDKISALYKHRIDLSRTLV